MLISDVDKKPHLISCEATCVHEEVVKRIPNVRFTVWFTKIVYVKFQIEDKMKQSGGQIKK